MRNTLRLTVVATIASGILGGAPLAAEEAEVDVLYTSKLIGEPTTLQIGQSKTHMMRRFELSTINGTNYVGATTALCNQIKVEDYTTNPSSFSYDAYCVWKDGDGDLIFETSNGGASSESSGPTVFGSGLIVGGTGKFKGITGGVAWSHDNKGGRKRGLYYLPGK